MLIHNIQLLTLVNFSPLQGICNKPFKVNQGLAHTKVDDYQEKAYCFIVFRGDPFL